MGSLNPTPELTLDFRPSFIPKTIAQFLEEMSRIGNLTNKLLQVDDFVTRLETEMRKIKAFEGELPLCMLLINDAIDALKGESIMLKETSKPEPVLEEFIPMKTSCNDDLKDEIISKQKENGDKKNWLSSTQLWNTHDNLDDSQKKVSLEKTVNNKRGEEEDVSKQFFSCHGIKNQMRGNDLFSSGPPPPQQTTTRKQRRCWSTELHRRFVGALQELGGSQAATPKQIRELMQVDGLTNDEVKSHLQKYRLHTRRLPSSNTNQIVEGGLWMPLQVQDQYVSKCSNSKAGSPDGPLPNGGNNMDDEEDEKSENYCWNGNL